MSKSLLDYIKERNLDCYGCTITVAEVQQYLGIDSSPDKLMTAAEFNEAALTELAATSAVREALIKEGKYFAKDGTAYRVLLPSENAAKAALLIDAGKRKYSKAATLMRHTPREHSIDQNGAKLNLLTGAVESLKTRMALLA